MLTLTPFIFCGAAALVAGFIDAIAGGAGLLTLPALLISGIPPHFALGVNKVSACLGTTVALVNFSRNKLVNWKLALYGLGFSIVGSWAGTLLALWLNPELLAKVIVLILPLAMLGTLFSPQGESEDSFKQSGPRYWAGVPAICFIIGLYDGFLGPGTGTFLIIALHWVLRMPLVAASGTAKVFNLASNVSAAVSFVWHGVIIWSLALVMGVCLMLGNWAGSAFAIKIGAKAVKHFLLISLGTLLLTLVWQYFIS